MQTGTVATAFGTIINAGTSVASLCVLAKPPGYPAAFGYQTTNAANQMVSTANTPVDIPAGAAQGFMFAITPSQDLNAAETAVIFACANTPVTVSVPGVNTLMLSSAAAVTPDLIAIGVTPTNDGIVNIPGATATGFFASAAVNIGLAAPITTTVDDGGRGLALTLSVCQTNSTTGVCLSPAAASTTTTFATNQVATFAIFATGTGNVPFDPANNRLFLRHRDAGGVTRGATNVAVRTFSGPAAAGQAEAQQQQRAALP